MRKIICFILLFGNYAQAATHYEYSTDEIEYLATRKESKLEVTDEHFEKWEPVIEHLAKQDVERLKAILQKAHADAVALSENRASLDPLTLKVIGLFFPDVRQPQNYQSDPYSEALAQMIFPKVKKQFEQEKNQGL